MAITAAAGPGAAAQSAMTSVNPAVSATPGGMLGPVDAVSASGVLQDVTSVDKADIEVRIVSTLTKVEHDTLKGLIRNTV